MVFYNLKYEETFTKVLYPLFSNETKQMVCTTLEDRPILYVTEQTKEIKDKEIPIKKEIAEVRKSNKKLLLPLREAETTAADRIRRMNHYEKEKLSLKNTSICLAKYSEEKTSLLRQHNTLENEFEKEEVFELRNNFIATLSEFQRRKELKNGVLEKKIQNIREKLEETETDIKDMLVTSKLDPATMAAVTVKLEFTLDIKNKTIARLQYKLCKASKAHDDLLELYERKLQQLGIPKEELGLVPLRTNVMSHAPAGLVTRNR
ncbi:dynein regulatory complex subunit 4-like [Schistocerca gregaria]|uniref:dynein regulatory complex subunit 4-like n=1 Tax=Schistocerca gregaria TaxID=7010 RepID=UPI00211E5D07|nr:dynein regulatory complex subunit 4-like [Schistocerca gregaria]